MYVFCAVGRDNADDALLEHLKRWVSENPPPAHVMLIAGDRGYARTLRQLRENKYNILLVTRDAPPSKVFSDIASILWKWSAILEKKPLGKHLNDPLMDTCLMKVHRRPKKSSNISTVYVFCTVERDNANDALLERRPPRIRPLYSSFWSHYPSSSLSSSPTNLTQICVWWDIKNCLIPSSCDASQIDDYIETALIANKVSGYLETIYGFTRHTIYPDETRRSLLNDPR